MQHSEREIRLNLPSGSIFIQRGLKSLLSISGRLTAEYCPGEPDGRMWVLSLVLTKLKILIQVRLTGVHKSLLRRWLDTSGGCGGYSGDYTEFDDLPKLA